MLRIGKNGRSALPQSKAEMVEAWGRLAQLLGVPRSTGQIYGLLYLSTMPQSLADIVIQLGISKASASNGTRQLAAWGAIKQVWVQGDRKDYFEVVEDLAALVGGGYRELFKPRLESSSQRLKSLTDSLKEDLESGALSREEYRLCIKRVNALSKLQKRIKKLAPLAEKLL